MWPRAMETEIGTALCAIGAVMNFYFECIKESTASAEI